jgi:hypothetical protein
MRLKHDFVPAALNRKMSISKSSVVQSAWSSWSRAGTKRLRRGVERSFAKRWRAISIIMHTPCHQCSTTEFETDARPARRPREKSMSGGFRAVPVLYLSTGRAGRSSTLTLGRSVTSRLSRAEKNIAIRQTRY